ncbi:Lsr2 family DNA-binding protein [Amycolatopsis japonica]
MSKCAWRGENGHSIAERGRISNEIYEAVAEVPTKPARKR